MTNEEIESLLNFLKKECYPTETLRQCSFRILCFTHNKHRPKLEYIQFDQKSDQALIDSNILIPDLNIKIGFSASVQDFIDLIVKNR